MEAGSAWYRAAVRAEWSLIGTVTAAIMNAHPGYRHRRRRVRLKKRRRAGCPEASFRVMPPASHIN